MSKSQALLMQRSSLNLAILAALCEPSHSNMPAELAIRFLSQG